MRNGGGVADGVWALLCECGSAECAVEGGEQPRLLQMGAGGSAGSPASQSAAPAAPPRQVSLEPACRVCHRGGKVEWVCCPETWQNDIALCFFFLKFTSIKSLFLPHPPADSSCWQILDLLHILGSGPVRLGFWHHLVYWHCWVLSKYKAKLL